MSDRMSGSPRSTQSSFGKKRRRRYSLPVLKILNGAGIEEKRLTSSGSFEAREGMLPEIRKNPASSKKWGSSERSFCFRPGRGSSRRIWASSMRGKAAPDSLEKSESR